jgi:hypothetical protein
MNQLRSERDASSSYSTHLSQERTRSAWTKNDYRNERIIHLFDSAKQGAASPDQGDELDAEGSSIAADIKLSLIVSKLQVTETKLLSLSKSKGTHEDQESGQPVWAKSRIE